MKVIPSICKVLSFFLLTITFISCGALDNAARDTVTQKDFEALARRVTDLEKRASQQQPYNPQMMPQNGYGFQGAVPQGVPPTQGYFPQGTAQGMVPQQPYPYGAPGSYQPTPSGYPQQQAPYAPMPPSSYRAPAGQTPYYQQTPPPASR